MENEKNSPGFSFPDIDRLVHEPSRLLILAQLYVVESMDYLFLLRQTGMTQGNLSSHLNRLEEGGCIEVTKEFVGKRPRTQLALTSQGREAFRRYVATMKEIFDGLDAEINR